MKVGCNKVREKKKSRATAAVSTYDPSKVAKLVERAAGGNFEAFGQLYGIYLDRIYRYAFHQVQDRMTAEDITEEVFVKAWKAIKSCKGKGRTFQAWIYRIAHNHIVNTLRNTRKFTSMEMEKEADFNDPRLDVEAKLEQQEVTEMIADLPPNQRQVILLKFIDGLDNKEIAKIMKKSEGAVRILQMRALTTLRQKIGGGKYGTGS